MSFVRAHKPEFLAVLLAGVLPLAFVGTVRADGPPVKGIPAKIARVAPPPAEAPVKPAVSPVTLTPTPGSADEVKQLIEKAPKGADYPNAASATLLDLMDVTVRPDGSSRSVVRQAIKIFSKRGRDDESEIKIGYNNSYETIKILRARTIKPDGTIVNVRPEEIRDSRPSDYDDVAVKAFSMPAVDDDCIIDYEYEKIDKEPLMAGNFWQPWYFQAGFAPVMTTRLTITAPKSFTINQQMRNSTVKPNVTNLPDGKTVRYVWEDKNVAPLELEPMMPDADKVLPRLYLSSVPNWQAVSAWYYDLAKDRMVADPSVKAKVKEVTAGLTTPEDKAKAIFYYVQGRTRYVAISLGKSAFQPRSAASVLTNQFGDCKDMATLLVAMLREVGVTANPVLLKAASKDKRSAELPSPGAFDHAICLAEIGGKQYWLDATAELCPWGVIPQGDRGCEVLVVKDGGKGEWVTIPWGGPEDNRSARVVKLQLNPDGSASGTVTITGNGDTDIGLRSVLRDLPEGKRRPYAEQLLQSIGANPRVSNVTVSDWRDMDKPSTITMTATFPTWASLSGDMLFFRARPDQTTGTSSSPFQEDFRRLPIEQTAIASGEATLEVKLPDGYEVLSAPKTTDVKNDLGEYARTVKQDGSTMTITVRGDNYRANVDASRYDDVRKYYSTYLRAADESVIIKKK